MWCIRYSFILPSPFILVCVSFHVSVKLLMSCCIPSNHVFLGWLLCLVPTSCCPTCPKPRCHDRTKWRFMCWCAVKKLLTHSHMPKPVQLTYLSWSPSWLLQNPTFLCALCFSFFLSLILCTSIWSFQFCLILPCTLLLSARSHCNLLKTGWPPTWKTWKSQGIWKWSGKIGEVGENRSQRKCVLVFGVPAITLFNDN